MVPSQADMYSRISVTSSGAIIQITIPLWLHVGSHKEELTFYLIASPRHLIVLGLMWLEAHNPIVDWCNHSITFSEPACSRKNYEGQLSFTSSREGQNQAHGVPLVCLSKPIPIEAIEHVCPLRIDVLF